MERVSLDEVVAVVGQLQVAVEQPVPSEDRHTMERIVQCHVARRVEQDRGFKRPQAREHDGDIVRQQ